MVSMHLFFLGGKGALGLKFIYIFQSKSIHLEIKSEAHLEINFIWEERGDMINL